MSSHTGYGEKAYWDVRYGGGVIDTYEWYMPWATLKPFCMPHIHAAHQPASQHAHLTLQQQRKAIAAAKAAAGGAATGAAGAAAAASHVAPSAGLGATPATAGSSPAVAAASLASPATSGAVDSSSAATDAAVAPPQPPCVPCLSSRMLIVGCGNSELSAHLFQDGFENQLSVDYSEVVITKMRELYASTPKLAESFIVGDCRDLRKQCPRGEADFDVVLDKGTLDAILCGADSNKNSTAMIAEIHRLLKPGGVFLVITYGQPSARLPHLERKQYSWNVTHVALGTTRFMYACQKRHPRSDG